MKNPQCNYSIVAPSCLVRAKSSAPHEPSGMATAFVAALLYCSIPPCLLPALGAEQTPAVSAPPITATVKEAILDVTIHRRDRPKPTNAFEGDIISGQDSLKTGELGSEAVLKFSHNN